ncbi:MAG: hypothetical protein GF398_02120 [Chitinivibrionales bacterium]|nr:hypothetical protein [Chitinivibrionales bacterium]
MPRLTALPDSIGALSSLTMLQVGKNQRTRLPESIGRLDNLENLSIWTNPIKKRQEFRQSGSSAKTSACALRAHLD